MFTLRTAISRDLARNVEIWQSAVRATHHFLSEQDFRQISKAVETSYLPSAVLVVAVDADDCPQAFMGTTHDHVDALFVHAGSRGRGIGSLLLQTFLASRDEATVDVNEQNYAGRSFYERLGFAVVGRSDVDDDGRPYPLLHMRWRKARHAPVVRTYRPDDLDAVLEVFIRAIRVTASRHYEPAQVEAWAQPDRQVWKTRRMSRPTWVAEIDGAVVGFTDLEPDGHIDMMYVHPSFAGRGVAQRLIHKAEAHACANGMTRLTSEVSVTARPFFEKQGFEVVEPETVFRNGQSFERFKMEKRLTRAADPD
jgi:ribosomal protein S18 acetylase RimI-like enzyme